MTGRNPAAGSLLSGPLPGFAELCVPSVDGSQSGDQWPLARYIPNVAAGSAANLLHSRLKPGSQLLDPFGSSPAFAFELAAAGYAVSVCMLNPVLRWSLENACEPPAQKEAQGWLARLSRDPHGDVTFADFIQSFYATTCRVCGNQVSAAEYRWRRGDTSPCQVRTNCPRCGSQQWADCDIQDVEIVRGIEQYSSTRTLAISRITSCGPGLEQDARDLVEAHNFRALFILHAIIGRLKAMNLPTRGRQVLLGLLLEALDAATTLWPLDDPQLRPCMLSVPAEYSEKNLWTILVEAAAHPFHPAGRANLVYPPIKPEPGEICLFPGRVREWLTTPNHPPVDAVVCAIPRPNQAFWKLSSAWSAWLLERAESSAFLNMISRDRYDWGWQARALSGLAAVLRQKLDPQGGLFGFISEVEPALLSAVLPAFQEGRWRLDAFSMDVQNHQAQAHWIGAENHILRSALSADIGCGAAAYLKYKGEPANYLEMTCAGLLQLQQDDCLLDAEEDASRQTIVKQGLASPLRFVHLGSGGQTMESGAWWLAHPGNQPRSYSDALELFVIDQLNQHHSVSSDELELGFRQLVPAIWEDPAEWIQAILKSYAIQQADGRWQIIDKERSAARAELVSRLGVKIRDLGNRLGYQVEGETPIKWLEKNGSSAVLFHIYPHTAFCGSLLGLADSGGQRVLALPASRLDLLAYKQKTLPGMRKLLDEGWLIVKFRLISRLLDNPFISRDKFQELIHTDPAEINPDQLFLF